MLRIGIGTDTHRLVEGRELILGGVRIASDRGAEGHSDADALTHAIADAILGALCEGDIGVHFPDKDPQWSGASSLELLSRECGWLVNAVSTWLMLTRQSCSKSQNSELTSTPCARISPAFWESMLRVSVLRRRRAKESMRLGRG